nr:hypothetical protein [Streptococcus oralis]
QEIFNLIKECTKMKKVINKLGLVTILLTSTSMISACSQESLEVGKSKSSTLATNIKMTKAPNNKKLIH